MGDFVDYSIDPKGIRRGARATTTPELINFLIEQYGFDQSSPFTDLGGSCSLNILATRMGNPFVVRIHLPCVTAARLESIHTIIGILRDVIPCAHVLFTKSGVPYCLWNGRLIEAEYFVAHDETMKSWERLAIGLPLLGRMHSAVEGIILPDAALRQPFVNSISAKRALEITQNGCLRIRSLLNVTDDELMIADRAEALAERLAPLEPNLPKQLTHGDFWDNNVYFKGADVVLVGDFDFMSVRPRIDDIALTFYFTDAEFTLFQPDNGKRKQQLANLMCAYNSGLVSPLTRTERAVLPLAMARQPLWCIGSWCVQAEDDADVRRMVSDMLWYVDWANKVVDELDEWQEAFSE